MEPGKTHSYRMGYATWRLPASPDDSTSELGVAIATAGVGAQGAHAPLPATGYAAGAALWIWRSQRWPLSKPARTLPSGFCAGACCSAWPRQSRHGHQSCMYMCVCVASAHMATLHAKLNYDAMEAKEKLFIGPYHKAASLQSSCR
eukprot:1159347-Pelagomonas_calceolata.AAC.3